MRVIPIYNILRKVWQFSHWDLRGTEDLNRVMKTNEETECCH